MRFVETLSPADRHRSVEDFLFREAEILDDRRFHDWLDLLTDDVTYRMPTRINRGRRQTQELSQPNEMAHFDDTKQTLEFRVARLDTSFAWAEQPSSRSRRIIGNVRITESEVRGELHVKSNVICHVNRNDTDTETWALERHDVLQADGDGWRIAERTIIPDQTVVLANSISIFF